MPGENWGLLILFQLVDEFQFAGNCRFFRIKRIPQLTDSQPFITPVALVIRHRNIKTTQQYIEAVDKRIRDDLAKLKE
jgi:hypothetical protein